MFGFQDVHVETTVPHLIGERTRRKRKQCGFNVAAVTLREHQMGNQSFLSPEPRTGSRKRVENVDYR